MKILVVDDDPTIRAVVEMVFEELDEWQVLVADSGEKAILLALAENPDLLLIDMHMPGMDGPATIAKMRENAQLAKLPVLFLTADDNAAEVCTRLQAKGYIKKPFDPRALPDQLSKFV
jgi:CheY-like chemotaxis protein